MRQSLEKSSFAKLKKIAKVAAGFASRRALPLGDLRGAYLCARGLSPLCATEGTDSPSPVRSLSKSVAPMPRWRLGTSGPAARAYEIAKNSERKEGLNQLRCGYKSSFAKLEKK